jgi:hypothetical protein
LLIGDVSLEPNTPVSDASIQKVTVHLRNTGGEACSEWKVMLTIVDSDNVAIDSVVRLIQTGLPGLEILPGDDKTVEFVPGPNLSGLAEGAYGLMLTAYCPEGSFQDQKIVYFSTRSEGSAAIPETSLAVVFPLLAVAVLLLFRNKK